MGHKVNANALRIGINKDWQSRWSASNNKDLSRYILEDYQIRQVLMKQLKSSNVSKIEIERTKSQITLFIHCVRVGTVLGQGAANLEVLTKLIQKTIKNRKINIKINVVEIKQPDLDAQILANLIATQIENRLSHRRSQRVAINRALRAGAVGIKTIVSGRLGGTEMARTEGYSEGKMPRSTLRMDIDYATATAKTAAGMIGVKVWVCMHEILPGQKSKKNEFTANNYRPRRFPNNNQNQNPPRNREVKTDGNTKKI